ncbi:low density lipoprotein receptor protein [Elysia marginata]|uniref:Low density lipoprotein receptor protein n=1 Tax=Elysia marginata TaxID=1093978 RepID=A0AAV4JF54_9GAST|nr:low density lipoprotein receptor protein [Elysia marginata]
MPFCREKFVLFQPISGVLQNVEECNGLTADWVSRHIYWTDAGKRTLEIANFDGSGRRVLVGSKLVNPRGVVVDPVYG